MKKTLLTAATALSFFASTAQETKDPFKPHNNEFGVDATGFIRQFFNFDVGGGSNYGPNYYITYRRHFGPGNLRFAIGGDYAAMDIPAGFPDDMNVYRSQSMSLDFRIGWEFKTELSKRWQVFYGLDFRPSFISGKDDASFFNGGYANGFETSSQNYGFAPLLGFRFRLTNRISLLTETSFAFNIQKISQRQYFTPVTSDYPALPDIKKENQKRVYTSYAQPLSVFITFDI